MPSPASAWLRWYSFRLAITCHFYHCYQYGDEHDIGNLTFRKGAEVGDEGSRVDYHDATQLLAVLRLKDDEYQTQHIHEDE